MIVRTVAADETPVFYSNAEYVSVDVQVLSRDAPVLGLKQQDFRVWDNGEPQSIVSFAAEDQALDLILLLDVSGSTMPIADRIRKAAIEALPRLRSRDRVAIAIFASRPYLELEPTSDWGIAGRALSRIQFGRGGTELNASVLYTARYLRKQARPEARRAMVILTDNKGWQAVPDQAVRNGLWESNVVLSALLFRSDDNGHYRGDVRRFVKATGGEVLKVKSGVVPFTEMFRRLRERYVLLYRPPGGAPGTTRTIRVDLSSEAKARVPGLAIRSRSGYRVGAATAGLHSVQAR